MFVCVCVILTKRLNLFQQHFAHSLFDAKSRSSTLMGQHRVERFKMAAN